jgi:hypothetical protein
MCTPRSFKSPRVVLVTGHVRPFPSRAISPGSSIRTPGKLGTVQVRSTTRRIGF